MKILYGEALSFEIREHCDFINSRLWVASPYIGGAESVLRIIGNRWIENPAVSVRLLTDASDFNNFNLETLKIILQRGNIRHLEGLHAKIYIIDDKCVVTSANLTQTAFAKRFEVGVLLDSVQSQDVIKIFEQWWKKAEVKTTIDISKKKKSINVQTKEDKNGFFLPLQWELPPKVKFSSSKLKKKFLDYPSILQDYQDFAEKYAKIQRLWKNAPLFLEVDSFLNYLYHRSPGRVSLKYVKKAPRLLSRKKQISEIKRHAKAFAKFAKVDPESVYVKDKVESHRIIKQALNLKNIEHLSKKELLNVLGQINALNSYPINKAKIISNNSLPFIKNSLKHLIHGQEELPARMSKCSQVKNMGTSTINELVGFYNPTKYPIINKNSNCGLRYFGYDIPAYR